MQLKEWITHCCPSRKWWEEAGQQGVDMAAPRTCLHERQLPWFSPSTTRETLDWTQMSGWVSHSDMKHAFFILTVADRTRGGGKCVKLSYRNIVTGFSALATSYILQNKTCCYFHAAFTCQQLSYYGKCNFIVRKRKKYDVKCAH